MRKKQSTDNNSYIKHERTGETVFWDQTTDPSSTNDFVTSVLPLYGRAVAFTGEFPHSALPPASGHKGARYTLAVKLSETKEEALMKTFHEESQHDVLEDVEELIRSVQTCEMGLFLVF